MTLRGGSCGRVIQDVVGLGAPLMADHFASAKTMPFRVWQELAGLTAQSREQRDALEVQLAEVSTQMQEAGAPAPRGTCTGLHRVIGQAAEQV